MDVRLRLVAMVLCGLVPPDASSAAPFVEGAPARLSVQIAASRAAVLVRPVRNTDGVAAWSIETVVSDSTGSLQPGQVIRPQPAPAPDTRLALVISRADRTVSSLPVSEDAAEYIVRLPRPDAAAEQRLMYALQHLAADDSIVAADVFAELAAFDRKSLQTFRQKLPVAGLRTLIDDPGTSGDRLGLFGYLLGLCGEPRDAERLRHRFLHAEPFAGGAGGLAAGYLLLSGEQGLEVLKADVLLSKESSPLLAAALFDVLLFLRGCDDSPIGRERLAEAACCGLHRPDVADLAVGYLAAAREWRAMPRVLELLTAEDENVDRKRAAQVVAVRFLLECRRDVDTSAVQRAMANNALTRIGSADPDLLRRAMHLAGELPAVQ